MILFANNSYIYQKYFMKRFFILFLVSGFIVSGTLFIVKTLNNKLETSTHLFTEKESQFDMPVRAALRDIEMMKDPASGTIPFKKFPVAMAETKMVYRINSNRQVLNWMQIPADMGGRTKTICIDPNDTNHHKLWAGSATGGLWVNQDISDADTAWTPVGDVWETLSISSIVFDPNNTQTMYVGTGEYETAIVDMYRESSGRGYGIWKSTDGGQSFQRLMSTSGFAYISDLAIKNENGQSVIYAGVVSGKYRGADFTAQPTEGLYRSSDGGQTWEQVLPNVPGTNKVYAISDIEITGSGKILVGTKRNFDDVGGGHILISDTGNPGSWTDISQFSQLINQESIYNIPGRVKIASAPSNPNKIYALFAAKSLQETIEYFPQTVCQLIVVSNDGGQTWQIKNTPSNSAVGNWAYLAWHALSVTVDPNDENRVFAGGLDNYVSNDGANTWQKISDWTAMYAGGGNNYVHGDCHRIIFLSGSSNELAISTDGGVFYTNNASNNNIVFQKRDKSYNTLQFYSAAISNAAGQEVLAGGLQDNGTVGYFGTPITETDMIQGGDGAFCKFDSDEPIIITSTYDNQFQIYNFMSGQQNWIYSYASGLFISTFDYDSQNNVIWVIASDLHNNRLNQVLKLTDILNSETGVFITLPTTATKYFSAIKLIDTDHFLIGTANGHLYKVSNINVTPTAVELGAGIFPDAFISSIDIADNAQRIIVTLSNYGVTSVWQSTDGGTTWHDVESNLPDMPIRWAIYHPVNPHQVMLATETGVWTTDNIDAATVNWQPANNSLPNVRVDMLDIDTNTLKVVAGTHGRGLFTTTWATVNSVNDAKQVDFKIFPNPVSDLVNIQAKKSGYRVELYDINGKFLKAYNMAHHKLSFSVKNLSSGIYFVKLGETLKRLKVER